MQDVAQEKKVLGCSPALTSGVRLLKMERPTLILVAPPRYWCYEKRTNCGLAMARPHLALVF